MVALSTLRLLKISEFSQHVLELYLRDALTLRLRWVEEQLYARVCRSISITSDLSEGEEETVTKTMEGVASDGCGAECVEVPNPVRLLLPGKKLGVGGDFLVACLRLTTFLYDCVSFIFFYLFQKRKPWERIKDHRKNKAQIESRGKGTITWKGIRETKEIHRELARMKVDTMHKVFSLAITKNGSKPCLGTRELLKEEEELQPNGKVFKKYVMGNYIWKTFDEVDGIAQFFSNGLLKLGLRPREKICIFAETRSEWLIAAVGAFKQSFCIVTLYATLGEEAVIHGLTETECSVVLTSHELLPKFKNILSSTPSVKHVIYMEHCLTPTSTTGFQTGVQIHAFKSVVEDGINMSVELRAPQTEDIAIIMYTSGSTGIPKGVLLTHKNVATAMMGLTDGLGDIYSTDIYIGYLPLAHVLELMCESICFLQGIPIGYSSPLTITDKSSKIKVGTRGDAVILKPTIMVSVPFALDRIYKGIQEQIMEGGTVKRTLFYYFYDYKLKWYYRGYSTPITDALIFKKARMIVGGQLRLIITGGAPLAEDTHEFVRNCLSLPLVQGYGLTESSATGTCSTHGDMSTGRVGPAFRCNYFRLADWEEGDYTVNDRPRPRGEILISGDNVAIGYYKLPEATAEDFFTENGRRWFRTGDIGEADYDGCFKVIDRKKDLVKLQMGEYLSLGKIESALKTSIYIENICICADSTKSYCVALIVPVQKNLEALASRLGKGDQGSSFDELCEDRDVIKAFLKETQSYGRTAKLQRFEIPVAIKLYSELWTTETNLVTAAFKLRRKNISQRFGRDIKKLYDDLEDS